MANNIARKPSMNGQHRAECLPDDSLRRTAEAQSIPSYASFRAYDDDFNLWLIRMVQNAFIRSSKIQPRARRDSGFLRDSC
ncbi:MAG TPA: hypothetical protein VGA17_00685 [Nitrospiraceae bacterium]